jgi:hypothetical protein
MYGTVNVPVRGGVHVLSLCFIVLVGRHTPNDKNMERDMRFSGKSLQQASCFRVVRE